MSVYLNVVPEYPVTRDQFFVLFFGESRCYFFRIPCYFFNGFNDFLMGGYVIFTGDTMISRI